MEKNNIVHSSMLDKKILILEDENEIRDLMSIILKRYGYNIIGISSVEEFRELFPQFFTADFAPPKTSEFDLMILDWMLPGMSGFELMKTLRKKTSFKSMPIIMVTAKAEPDEVVEGLEAGADDYLIKPFDASVLLARVNALLRRQEFLNENSNSVQSFLKWGDLKVNLNSYEVLIKDQKVTLTLTEFKILVTMMKGLGKVFTREQLIQSVQGEGVNVIGRTIDTHVFSLRKKLDTIGENIETVRGIGYRFCDQGLK